MVSFDADVVGYQYKLGTRHPVFDICDMYAKADMFDLGAGIFPKDKVPQVPVHPHCLCKYKVLYKGQVDLSKQVDRQKEAIAEWLDGLDKQRAIQVLGVGGYKSYIAGNDARVKGYTKLGEPNYKNIKSNLLNKVDKNVIINMAQDTIESCDAGVGKPMATMVLGASLSGRQKYILSNLQKAGDYIEVSKNKVGMRDLSVLTQITGVEFAMFTKQGKRLVYRGDSISVPVDIDLAEELKAKGYKWSGHTHPGDNANCLVASDGDKLILLAFNQECSSIYNSRGEFVLFDIYA